MGEPLCCALYSLSFPSVYSLAVYLLAVAPAKTQRVTTLLNRQSSKDVPTQAIMHVGDVAKDNSKTKYISRSVYVMLLVLASCQATGTTPGETTYNIFFSPSGHIKQLLEKDDLETASGVYESQRDYFAKKSESRRAVADQLAAALKKKMAPDADKVKLRIESVSWPVAKEPDVLVLLDVAPSLWGKSTRPTLPANRASPTNAMPSASLYSPAAHGAANASSPTPRAS